MRDESRWCDGRGVGALGYNIYFCLSGVDSPNGGDSGWLVSSTKEEVRLVDCAATPSIGRVCIFLGLRFLRLCTARLRKSRTAFNNSISFMPRLRS